jgi:hypothetical protein
MAINPRSSANLSVHRFLSRGQAQKQDVEQRIDGTTPPSACKAVPFVPMKAGWPQKQPVPGPHP